MSTNNIVLRSVEEVMSDYTPQYQPIYPLLLRGKAQAYSEVVGKLTFKRVEAVGDIRMKHITPKDTEKKEVGAKESSRVFKKYFLGNRFVNSVLQDQSSNESVAAQVLDENQKLQDELLLKGEGTSDSDVVNNGLFWSGDSFHTTESSVELDTDADANGLIAMHAQVMVNAQKADQLAGRKLIIFYGSNVLPKFDGLFAATNASFKDVLQKSLGANYEMVKLPEAVTPASSHGWLIINLDQIKVNYCSLPVLKNQGVNEENGYTWHNFLMGSMMVECLALNAIIKQPVTFEA